MDTMTIDQWTVMDTSQKTHINRFIKAYKLGMERDPINFKKHLTAAQWESEYALYVDVDGDAEDPISGMPNED